MTENRKFKGIWIPREVYLDQDICWTAKLIFLEIDSFTENDKDCFASNAYLAKQFGIKETQVSRHITSLKNKGWIVQTGFDGKKRYLRSNILALYSNTTLSDNGALVEVLVENTNQDLSSSTNLDLSLTTDQTCTGVHDSLVLEDKHTNTNILNNSLPLNNDSIPYVIESGEIEKEEIKTPAKRPKKQTVKKPVDPSYTEMMKIYYEWYQERNSGTPPKIDGAEGNALKSIIVYFKTIYNSRPEPKKTEFEELCWMWRYVFNNWSKLDPFHQKNLKLTQINSNITNIIDYLKNGREQKPKLTDKSNEAVKSRLHEAVDLARAKVTGGKPNRV